MAKTCTICEKRSSMKWNLVKLRGKYNPTSKTRKYPNLQWVKIPAGTASPKAAKEFVGQRILACTKCIKSLEKQK